MDLTGRLRQRSEQSKAIAQVDCGDLGVLTVQGLPLRECEALAAGPDGDRALFYAASSSPPGSSCAGRDGSSGPMRSCSWSPTRRPGRARRR